MLFKAIVEVFEAKPARAFDDRSAIDSRNAKEDPAKNTR